MIIITKNADEDSNNLSTTSIKNCWTSENNVIGTTETPKNNDVIDNDLAASTRKKQFQINTTPFKIDSTETEFNKRKNFSPIICELNTRVSNKAVEGFSSKQSGVDFDVVIINFPNKSFPAFHKPKNYAVIEAGQTTKHSDEQVNTRKEIQTAPTENTNNADNSAVQQNNEEWRKGTTIILGDSAISELMEKQENQSQIFPRGTN